MNDAAVKGIGSGGWASHKIQNVIPSRTTAVQTSCFNKRPFWSFRRSIFDRLDGNSGLKNEVRTLKTVLKDPVVELKDGELMAMRQCLDQAAIMATEIDLPPEETEGYLRIIAKMQVSIEEIAGKHLAHISKQTKLDSEQLDLMNIKKTEVIYNEVLKSKDAKTWAEFSNVMQYFLSASTMVLGSVLMATGAAFVAGSFILAAGGLGLMDRVANDTHAYQSLISYFTKSREIQERIAGHISSSILLATMGLGLYAGMMNNVGNALNLAGGALNAVNASKKVETAISLATAGAGTGKAWKEKQVADIKNIIQLMDGKIFRMKEEMRRHTTEAKNTISMMQIITKSTRQTVAAAG